MTNFHLLSSILFFSIYWTQIYSQDDSSSTSTTINPPNTSTLSTILSETENGTSTAMLQNTTFLDVGQNNTTSNNILNTTRGPLFADNNNTFSTTPLPNNITNTTIILLTTLMVSTNTPNNTTDNVFTKTLNNISKIISHDSTEHVEKKERSILASGSVSSSSSIEEKDDGERKQQFGNNLMENNIPNNLSNNNNKIPSRLLIYAVQRNSNYVEEDFGANSIPSTDKANISKEDKTKEGEEPKLTRRKRQDYFSDAINKLNNPMAAAQQQLLQQQQQQLNFASVASQPKIIPIPPNSPNIIFTSETGNVTVQKAPGFMAVETVMHQK